MEILSFISDTIGIVGSIFAFSAWYQSQKIRKEMLEDKKTKHSHVTVKLRSVNCSKEISLPVELRREELTRAELLGRLGMLPMREKGKRYALAHLSKPKFLQDINRLALSKKESELIIPCSEEEMKQFSLT